LTNKILVNPSEDKPSSVHGSDVHGSESGHGQGRSARPASQTFTNPERPESAGQDDTSSSGADRDNTENSRAKLHLFLPSGRKVWVVVGKENEHWVDPELEFCSCKSYYFKTLSDGEQCYHLKTVRKSQEDKGYTTTEFSDSEYTQFTKALLQDIANTIMLGG
jgi:predicted nucleic acid-binding Zn finger protein